MGQCPRDADTLEEQIQRRSRGRDVVLVGHSMGGMIGTLVASRMPKLRAFINVEGPLTLADLDTARKAAESKGFTRWFRDFKRDVRTPGYAPAHYAASLDEADPFSFHDCAADIVALARGARIAKMYASLLVPHVFFYGRSGGQSKRSVEFLRTHGCKTISFAGAAHWPMTETPAQFERELARSLANLGKARHAS